jgi:hypothetical protein
MSSWESGEDPQLRRVGSGFLFASSRSNEERDWHVRLKQPPNLNVPGRSSRLETVEAFVIFGLAILNVSESGLLALTRSCNRRGIMLV